MPAHYVPLDALGISVDAVVFFVVAITTFRSPAAGVAALVCIEPFGFHRDVGHTTITLAKVALVAAMLALALRRPPLAVLGDPAARGIALAGLAVAGATALSIVHAAHHGPVLRETLKALEYLALFAVVVVATRADRRGDYSAYAFAGVVIAVGLLALRQEWSGAPSGLWFHDHPIPRIAGPLEGPNQLAGYLGIALSAVFAIRLGRQRAAFHDGALGVGAASLVLTISRTGLLCGALSLALVGLLSQSRVPRRAPLLAFAGGAIFGVAILALAGYQATHSSAGFHLLGRFSDVAEAGKPGSVGTRSQLWRAALLLWHRSPLLGIGAGNFELALPSAGYPHLRTHANSLYLQALAEGGVVLLAATLALTFFSIWTFARGPFRLPLVTAAFAASVGFATHQIFDLLVFFPKVGDLFWIVLGLGAATVDAERAKTRSVMPVPEAPPSER